MKHLRLILGTTIVIGGALYLIYHKQTSAKSASSGTSKFTGGYSMINGSTDGALTAQLNSLNCIELAALYNKLKAVYVSGVNQEQYMSAMTTVRAHMLNKGCAIDKSGS